MTEMERIDAPFLDGWFAHKNNMPSNSYGESTQAYSYQQWEKGFVRRYNAVRHGGDLEYDNEI